MTVTVAEYVDGGYIIICEVGNYLIVRGGNRSYDYMVSVGLHNNMEKWIYMII